MTPVTGVRAAPARTRALLAWGACMLLALWVIARSQFSADLSAFLPASPAAQQRVLIEQLQGGALSRTVLVGIEGGDASRRAKASKALAAAMRESAQFDQVQNGDESQWAGAAQWLFEHRYALSPDVSAAHFQEDGLREALADTLSALGTPAGGWIKPLLERDPTGETLRIAQSLLPASAPRSQEGVWVSRNSPRALLLATTKAPGGDIDAQARALQAVRDAFATLGGVQGASPLSLQLSGPGSFAVQSRASIEREVHQLAIAGTVVMGVLLFAAFASLRALGAAVVPVVTGIVGGIAAVSLVFGGQVHGITLGFGSTLIGEAVDYAIYYLIQARAPAGSGSGWRRWRDENWPTVRLGLLTSLCGFAALAFSGFPGLAQLGVFSMAGLCAAAASTRWVLPAIAPDGASGAGLRGHLARIAAFAMKVLPRLKWAAWALGAAGVVLLAQQGATLWRADLASLSPVPPAAQALDAELRADLGASDARTLVVATGADLDQALQSAEAAAGRLDALVEQGVLSGYDSPARVLPSRQAQDARRAALPPPDVLRVALARAARGGPLRAERLEPFIAEVAAARQQPPITHAELAGTALGAVADAMLLQRRGGGWSALLPLQAAGGQGVDAQRVAQALQGVAGVEVVDIKRELDALYASYLHEALWQTGAGALAVLVLLALYLRSAARLAAVVVPLALAVLLTLAGLAALDVPLGILHLVGLLLVMAVGSNYTLFFDQLRRDGHAGDDTLASLLLANLTTVASFGLIALSGIPALSAIGRVVAPGALLAMLLAVVFSGRAHAAGKARDPA